MRDLLQVLRVFPGVLLILGVFGSLAQGSAVLAAAPPYPCPTTKSQLQADITAVGAGGTVSLSCPAATTIPFTGSPITITQDVTVDASHSPGRITVDGGNTTQLFAVNAGVNFGVISLTLANGLANTNDGATNNNGGAIFSDGNTVTVTDDTFTGNMAANNGGAIGNDAGTVNVTDSTFSDNSASPNEGGAIFNYDGTVSVTDSTFSGNSTGSYGGAIANYFGAKLTVSTSTFSHNTAQDGGALANNGTATVENSTFSGNSATNGAGGAISTYGTDTGAVQIGGDIFANNPGGNCDSSGGATISDAGYNLDTDGSCTSGQTGDRTGVNPLLAPLGNYGGPTPTMALFPGSPAIDQIPVGTSIVLNTNSSTYYLCAANGTDQRGYPRPDGSESVCDMGAYEFQDYAYGPTSGNAYDIESSNFSCTGGGSACVPMGSHATDCAISVSCPGLTYGDAEAFGRPNGSVSGTPDELVLYCSKYTSTGLTYGYLDVVSNQGNTDYPKGSRAAAGVYGSGDLGSITGQGTLVGGNGGEDNPSQVSSLHASALDTTRSIHGTVSGVQNTDNDADSLNSGGFTVTLAGTLHRVTTTGMTPTTSTYQGTISCQVGGSHALDLANAGKDTTALAEGELEDVLGDNQYVPVEMALLGSYPST